MKNTAKNLVITLLLGIIFFQHIRHGGGPDKLVHRTVDTVRVRDTVRVVEPTPVYITHVRVDTVRISVTMDRATVYGSVPTGPATVRTSGDPGTRVISAGSVNPHGFFTISKGLDREGDASPARVVMTRNCNGKGNRNAIGIKDHQTGTDIAGSYESGIINVWGYRPAIPTGKGAGTLTAGVYTSEKFTNGCNYPFLMPIGNGTMPFQGRLHQDGNKDNFSGIVKKQLPATPASGIAIPDDIYREDDPAVTVIGQDNGNLIAGIPISQKVYEGENYRAVVEGFNARLTEIEVFPDTYYITDREKHLVRKRPRFGVGLQAGYGITAGRPAPYVGVGIQYNLWTF